MIKNESSWKGFFDLALLFFTGINIFGNAYIAAFDAEESIPFYIADQCIETMFLLDIIFNFFEEYIDDETYIVVSDLISIGKNYLKGSFFFDLLAWLPFDIITPGHSRVWRLFKLLRLPRFA